MTGPSASGSENGTPTSMHVGARAIERLQDLRRARQIRVAGGRERDQAGPPFASGCARTCRRVGSRGLLHASARLFSTVCTSLSPRPERFTSTRRVAAQLARDALRVRDRVRRLERRQDALEPRQRLERLAAPRRRWRTRIRRGRARAATHAPGRPPRSPARPKSNASARCSRPRPAARRCACPAARRRCRRQTARRAGRGRSPSPPASTPISRTSRSSMNASNMPMALLPPPTQATMAVGRRAGELEELRARLASDHRLELAHHQRIGMRTEHGAQQVVGVRDVGDPVAHRLVDGVLQRARAGVDAADLGAEQAHPEDVERLPIHVLGAHVDVALEPEQRAGGRASRRRAARRRSRRRCAACPCGRRAAPGRSRC